MTVDIGVLLSFIWLSTIVFSESVLPICPESSQPKRFKDSFYENQTETHTFSCHDESEI